MGRITSLDPLRPARDLLEHLLDGMRACLLVYREEQVNRAVDADAALDGDDDFDDDEFSERVAAAFTVAVRERAAGDRARLT